VPPTKSSLLEISKNRTFALEGFELLEQKRQILVLELMSRVAAARRYQAEVEENMAKAFAALRDAVINAGSAAMDTETVGIRLEHRLEVDSQRVMGIELPTIKATLPEPGLQFGFGHGSAASDDVMQCFHAALVSLTHLAEIESVIFRLARELRKTQRRLNALEKIFLPDYAETLVYITNALEEREREGFVIMRMIKRRREAADAAGGG